MNDDNKPAAQVTENLLPVGNTPTSEVQLETLEQISEAIGAFALEITRQHDVIEAMGELVKAMDARIKMVTVLVDYDHEVLTKLVGLPPRPKEERLAN